MAKTPLDDMADSVTDSVNETTPPKALKIRRRDGLSTGSTLLNLGCTDNPFVGFVKGKYYLLVGDSSSGKTFLAMNCFAEAAHSKSFKDYELIYDNCEDGMLMDVLQLFGRATEDRIRPPRWGAAKEPLYSYTVEEFYHHVDDAVEAGKPFIYVLDSMDALTSEQEVEKFQAHKRIARGKGKKGDDAGTYGVEKAKINSSGLRKLMGRLRDSGSILIILSQTRANLGFGHETKSRSGGNALRFYATVEIWTSVTGQIRKTVKGKARPIGIHVKMKLKKNRITGKTPVVETDIYPSYGIDDVGTCVDYLVEEGWWATKKQSIEAGEFDLTATRAKLIEKIEREGWANELRSIVGKCWAEIESLSTPDRPSRY